MSESDIETARLAAQLIAFDTATLYEAAGQRGAMAPGIHALTPAKRAAGPALTVICPPGDNLMLHAAVAEARPGEILVAQCHDPTIGVWGEVLTVAALAQGVAGLVIDGAVRDIDSIRALGFPVFARGTALRAARKAALGCLRAPISCGGLLVWPGDYVVADDSGIVVLGAAAVDATLQAAQARREKETALMESLRQGRTTMELLNLESILNGLTQDRRRAP
jgi:4-hydroxy-4-methyl-2-oxoglutarate aldolase